MTVSIALSGLLSCFEVRSEVLLISKSSLLQLGLYFQLTFLPVGNNSAEFTSLIADIWECSNIAKNKSVITLVSTMLS